MRKLLIGGVFFLSFFTTFQTEAKDLARKPDHIFYFDQSLEYNSNVITNVDEAATNEDDIVLGTIALFDMSLIDRQIENYDIHLSFMTLQYLYDEFDNLDFRYHAPGATFWWLLSPEWALQVKGGYAITQEDNKDLFLGAFGEVEAEHPLSEDSTISLAYKINDQDYKPAVYAGRDALKHRLEAEWEKDWKPGKLRSSLKGRADYNDADNDGFSYYGLEGEAGIDIYQWPDKLDWYFSAGFLYRDYDDIYPGESEAREDERITLTGEATYPIYQDIVSLSLTIEYLNNFSNLEAFDYDEVIVGGHVIVIF
jgi:hypothetical protein